MSTSLVKSIPKWYKPADLNQTKQDISRQRALMSLINHDNTEPKINRYKRCVQGDWIFCPTLHGVWWFAPLSQWQVAPAPHGSLSGGQIIKWRSKLAKDPISPVITHLKLDSSINLMPEFLRWQIKLFHGKLCYLISHQKNLCSLMMANLVGEHDKSVLVHFSARKMSWL